MYSFQLLDYVDDNDESTEGIFLDEAEEIESNR